MRIGRLETSNPYFLAPMAGITDVPFRTLCKELGCGLVYTEMVSAKGLARDDRKSWKLAFVAEAERPAGVQIFGADPGAMAAAAAKLAERPGGCDLIDINMGCPVQKVVRSGEGSALMKDPALAGRIVRAVVGTAGGVPVTAKIRKGWDEEGANAVEVALVCEDNGAAAVAVHGRTRGQFYGGVSDRSTVAAVKKAIRIPVVGSGDVFSCADAKAMMEETGCDAVMVARGALGAPWIFAELAGMPAPGRERKREIALRHYRGLIELKGVRTATMEMRKHAAWYTKGARGSAALRARIFAISDPAEMEAAIGAIFGEEPT